MDAEFAMRYLRGLNTLGGGSTTADSELLLLLRHLSLRGSSSVYFSEPKRVGKLTARGRKVFRRAQRQENGGIRQENIEIKCIWKLVFEENQATACCSRTPGAPCGFVRVSLAPEGPVIGLCRIDFRSDGP